MPKKDLKAMTMEERVARLESIVREQTKRLNKLETELAILETQFEEKHSKKDYIDVILEQNDKEVCLLEIAAAYGLEWDKLVEILQSQYLVEWTGRDGYKPKEKAVIKNLFNRSTARWTQKGRLEIHKILNDLGIEAIMDKQA